MSDRFFIDKNISGIHGDTAALVGDEAHHFIRVMRGSVGASVILFDGTGVCYRGTVTALTKNEVRVAITETLPDTIESPIRLIVASALPKGDRQKFLIEKIAELGVAGFIPVSLERSVARANDAVLNRFRRYVIESAKQCDRNVLMEISEELPLSELNELLDSRGCEKYLLHPVVLGEVGQTTARNVLKNTPKDVPQHIAVLVGPEGSFTDGEVEMALQFGFKPLDLGARILRTETACIAAAAVLLCTDK
ncbi:ribosomal RNA small subunit methyltransferase E [Planctomycetales bacterium]|nr:ribosomal RNA small subunit methyltransferase E [Planctomycetales bacterium]